MSTAMVRPFKHPKTGIYYVRKRVPVDLIALFGGKAEIKRSLGTKDVREAKIRCLAEIQNIEASFLRLRNGEALVTERDALNLAQIFYEQFYRKYFDDPSVQDEWPRELYDELWKSVPVGQVHSVVDQVTKHHFHPARRLERRCLAEARITLEKEGFRADESSALRLAKAIAAAYQQASIDLLAMPAAIVSSKRIRVGATSLGGQKDTSFTALFDAWAAQGLRKKAKTLYEWKRMWFKLRDFVQVEDASKVTEDDVRAWRDDLIDKNLDTKTINDAYFAAIRSIFRWAVVDKKIDSNPAAGVKVFVERSPIKRIRGYSEEEAAIIISASVAHRDPIIRWISLLLAYTGARLSEICQLRREDVVREEGIWHIIIRPEAGSLKNESSERRIPLHPEIIDQNFLEFVFKGEDVIIFSTLSVGRFGSRGGHATKIIGAWVRSLGLTDSRLSPCHSWRHRFKTLSRQFRFDLENTNALLGHSQAGLGGGGYGSFPLEPLNAEILKLPRVKVR